MKAGDRVRVITPAGSKYYRRALRISRSGQIEAILDGELVKVGIRFGMRERRLGAIIVPIGDLKAQK